jgi:GT2 family glycosyltransferase
MASDDRLLRQDAADEMAEPMTAERSAAPSVPAQNPPSILVLGMHRSGTSAVSRVLGLMGAEVGSVEDLLPAHPTDNPTGYWERADLNAIHDRLLASTGHSWNRVAGFDPHALDAEACAAFSQQLQGVVGELNASGRPWLAKDPRLCLLLSQWQPLLSAPVYLVVVRDPREIAASMSTGPRGTFTSPFVIALWEKYFRTLLAELVGKQALFVSYANLLAHPLAQCKRLLRGLDQQGVTQLHVAAATELSAFLDPQLKRSAPKAHVQLSSAQSALQKWLETQSRADGSVLVENFPDAPPPDAVLAEYEAAFDFHIAHGRGVAMQETHQHLIRIDQELNASTREREQRAQEVAREREQHAQDMAREREQHAQDVAREREQRAQEVAHERDQRAQDVAHQRKQHALELAQEREQRAHELARQHELHAIEIARERGGWLAELGALRTQIESAHQTTMHLQAALTSAQQERDTTRAQLEQLTRHSQAQDERVAVLNHHASAMDEREHALRRSWSWKITAPVRGAAGLFRFRPAFGFEQRLYRLYYALPGLNPSRKRSLILWLHENMPWLTRHTLSYQFYEQTQLLLKARASTREERERSQRMDAEHAAPLIAAMENPPLISVVMPVYNVERRWLIAAVESMRRQFYPHWELCIADDASSRAETRDALREIGEIGDARIKINGLKQNRGIAGASNAALQLATGDYVGLLDNDDEITRDALLEVAQAIIAGNPDVIYSDEDKLDADGEHVEPNFKPDFNLDYFLSINYVCHFAVIRRALLERIGGFREGFDGAQDYDLLLRATEDGTRVAHIAKVLYHWRKITGSTASASSAKPKSWEAGHRALTESVARRGIAGEVEWGPYPNTFRVRRSIQGQPLVSILLPFRDKPGLLSTCIQSILSKTDYARYEIIGIDNGSVDETTHALMRTLERGDSRVRFIRHDVPFNYSAINNFGARLAQGEHILMLNNDTEVIAPGWLRAMLEHSQRPEVGVVGAKLLYPDQRIQHAGVIVGIGGVAGHSHLLLEGDRPGYFARAQLPQNLSAVTFACAMTRRAIFEQLGGLNEQDLTIAFNDIDYCLRAREAGYLIVYTPLAELFHHESLTRGYEDNPEKQARFGREISYMLERHRGILEHGDPCYNPNLRLDTHDFSPLPGYADSLPL